MKIISSLILLLFISTLTFSQTILIRGIVNDQQGNPVPVAFIRDAKHNYATYSDSTGRFSLKADLTSSLVVSAHYYKESEVKIDNKTQLTIVMVRGTAETHRSSNDASASNARDSFILNKQLLVSQGSPYNTAVKAGFNQEETRGSRYLFKSWIPGFGISKGDSIIQDMDNVYNYDKINGNLLFTRDRNIMSQISKQQVKSFSLFDGSLHPHVYESAPEISDKTFVEVIAGSPKYKIYKTVDTKLQRADFHTDGVIESGHRYDEYIDAERYYFVRLPNGRPETFSLRKNAIKKLFAGDADKFISAQGSRNIDENYLKDLMDSLGQ
ncbi:MAG: hypothetical protein JWR02_1120 [Mucilaginibacter sp.]|nr:hypothetical protein [Mucilaginibacter sp.]